MSEAWGGAVEVRNEVREVWGALNRSETARNCQGGAGGVALLLLGSNREEDEGSGKERIGHHERIRTAHAEGEDHRGGDAWSSRRCADRRQGRRYGVRSRKHCGVANEISLILTAQNSKSHFET